MNNNYNLLMARRINMIEQNTNEEYIRKFNLSLDTIKRKKKRTYLNKPISPFLLPPCSEGVCL